MNIPSGDTIVRNMSLEELDLLPVLPHGSYIVCSKKKLSTK